MDYEQGSGGAPVGQNAAPMGFNAVLVGQNSASVNQEAALSCGPECHPCGLRTTRAQPAHNSRTTCAQPCGSHTAPVVLLCHTQYCTKDLQCYSTTKQMDIVHLLRGLPSLP